MVNRNWILDLQNFSNLNFIPYLSWNLDSKKLRISKNFAFLWEALFKNYKFQPISSNENSQNKNSEKFADHNFANNGISSPFYNPDFNVDKMLTNVDKMLTNVDKMLTNVDKMLTKLTSIFSGWLTSEILPVVGELNWLWSSEPDLNKIVIWAVF